MNIPLIVAIIEAPVCLAIGAYGHAFLTRTTKERAMRSPQIVNRVGRKIGVFLDWLNRPRVQTAGMLLAFVCIAGSIAYTVERDNTAAEAEDARQELVDARFERCVTEYINRAALSAKPRTDALVASHEAKVSWIRGSDPERPGLTQEQLRQRAVRLGDEYQEKVDENPRPPIFRLSDCDEAEVPE